MSPEREPRRELEKREVATRAFFEWVKVGRELLKPFKLSRRLELSAATLPTLLLTTMIGCSLQETVECTQAEEGFIETARDWVSSNPEYMQAEFDELWGPTVRCAGNGYR